MRQGLKTYIATTLPNVILSLIFGMFNEGYIGLDPLQVAISRTLAIIYKLSFSKKFYKRVGIVLIKLHHKEGQPIKYWLINGICSVIFWMSLYFVTLVIIGVPLDKIWKVLILPSASSFLAGTPLRWVSDQLIRVFNIPSHDLKGYIVGELSGLLNRVRIINK